MTCGRPRRSASIAGTTPMTPSVEAIPVSTSSGAPSVAFLTASARMSEVATASEPWIASSLTWTPLWAPICRAFLIASAAPAGPTVTTVTSPSPAASTSFRASSTAYSSSSESSPSTPSRSMVLSDSRNVRSDWASGTCLTQTTMFMRASSSSLAG